MNPEVTDKEHDFSFQSAAEAIEFYRFVDLLEYNVELYGVNVILDQLKKFAGD